MRGSLAIAISPSWPRYSDARGPRMCLGVCAHHNKRYRFQDSRPISKTHTRIQFAFNGWRVSSWVEERKKTCARLGLAHIYLHNIPTQRIVRAHEKVSFSFHLIFREKKITKINRLNIRRIPGYNSIICCGSGDGHFNYCSKCKRKWMKKEWEVDGKGQSWASECVQVKTTKFISTRRREASVCLAIGERERERNWSPCNGCGHSIDVSVERIKRHYIPKQLCSNNEPSFEIR